MPTVLSEVLRENEDKVADEEVAALYDYYQSAKERNRALKIGSAVLQTHLTTSRPESFIEQRAKACTIQASAFLSTKERSQYLEQLKGPFQEAGESDVTGDLAEAQERDSTILCFGQKIEAEEETDVWVVGTVVYIEPNERLIGPDHGEKKAVAFGRELIDRGGTFLVLNVPPSYQKRVAAACTYVIDNVQ